MKLVPEKINEISFERGADPVKSMNLGKKARLLKDLEKEGIREKDIEILPNFIILPSASLSRYSKLDTLREIAIKHMPEKYSAYLRAISEKGADVQTIVQDALGEGLSKEDIEALGEYTPKVAPRIKIFLAKATRTAERIEEEDEENIYIFIGYTDKVPVMVNDKQYYENKFVVEKMVKIDKYNIADLTQVEAMKLRVRFQDTKYENYSTYMLRIPKEVMDEEMYTEIPPHLQDIVEKYKVRI